MRMYGLGFTALGLRVEVRVEGLRLRVWGFWVEGLRLRYRIGGFRGLRIRRRCIAARLWIAICWIASLPFWGIASDAFLVTHTLDFKP